MVCNWAATMGLWLVVHLADWTAASKDDCLVEWKVLMMVANSVLLLAVHLVDKMASLKVY